MKAIAFSAGFALAVLHVPMASAETNFERLTSFDLALVRGAETSRQCNLIDDDTRARVISNMRMRMARRQAEAHIYDFDTAASVEAALAEGRRLATPERCHWYEQHHDNAADQVSIMEGIAYGPAGKPK